MRWLVMVVVLAACSGGRSPALDGGPGDAAIDAAPIGARGPFAPATIRFRAGHAASFGDCTLDGAPVAYGALVLVDDCVECQCTTFGLRCRKRATCPDDRCVFVDSQSIPRGDSAIVESCFDCTCDAAGPACRRRTAAPCPTDGCPLGDLTIAVGEERFVSECHRCRCDEAAGLLCDNACSPECHCTDETDCAAVCGELACPLAIPDQERVDLSCGSLVCDYGSLLGACP